MGHKDLDVKDQLYHEGACFEALCMGKAALDFSCIYHILQYHLLFITTGLVNWSELQTECMK